jgi:hypothetical protein
LCHRQANIQISLTFGWCAALVKAEHPALQARRMELTILMPCLNESETIARCIRKAKRAVPAILAFVVVASTISLVNFVLIKCWMLANA